MNGENIKSEKEIERIKKAYELRKDKISSQLYSFFSPGNLFIMQRREWEILKILKQFGVDSLEDKKILDVGCGSGSELRNFIRYGALPENCFGIDLLSDSIQRACKISSNIDFRCGNAEKLPYADSYFDIILLFTVFSSIFDLTMKRNISFEILRVLKSNGIIIYYDFRFNNPQNADVRGVNRKDIYELFPNCDIYLKRITLAPPIVRIIAPYLYLACYALEKLRILNTHYIGVIKKLL